MKRMISALVITGVLGGGLGAGMSLAQAQPGGDGYRMHHGEHMGKGCERGKFRLEKMKDELGLSDEQVTKLTSIRESYQPRMEELRDKSRDNREKLRDAKFADKVDMDSIKKLAEVQGDLKTQKIILHAEMRNELHAVLTAEQLAKVKEMKQKFRDKMRDRYKERHGDID